MKKKYKILLCFVSILSAASLHAQQKISLEQAVQLGIKNAHHLKIDAAKIEEAKANYLEAKNRQLPSLAVSASALALANADVELKMMHSGNGNTPKANAAYFGNLSASLPLYAGGRIRYGIQSADYLVKAAELTTENDTQAIAYNIAQAYNNLFKARQALKILEQNLAAAQQRDKTFQNLENNGIIARNDKLKANLQTSNIELQLLDAQNNFNIANVNMNLLLGLEDSTLIEVDDSYINDIAETRTATYFLQQASENRKDMQATKAKIQAAHLAVKSAHAEELPSIALTGGYVAADIPKILTVVNAANIGISVQYNIDQLWKKNTTLHKAQAQEKQLVASEEQLTDDIRLNVNRDYQNAVFAERKISVYEKASEQAIENYRVTKNKFDNGLATTTELLDADTAQIGTSLDLANAHADAVLATKKLYQTAGILHFSEK